MHRGSVYRAYYISWSMCNAAIAVVPSTTVLTCAGHNRKLRLLGISTVAGNQTVEKVTVNALGVVDAAGLQRISKSAAIQTKQTQDSSDISHLCAIRRCVQRTAKAIVASSGKTAQLHCKHSRYSFYTHAAFCTSMLHKLNVQPS